MRKTQSQEVINKYTGIFAISIDDVIHWDLYDKMIIYNWFANNRRFGEAQ